MRCSRVRLHQIILDAKESLLLPYGSDKPIFSTPLTWKLTRDPNEAWACFGPAASVLLKSALLARARAVPHIPRPWTRGRQLSKVVHRVSFETRLENRISTGAFTDYTARYGHLLEEDQQTLSEHLLKSLVEEGVDATEDQLKETAAAFKIDHLLTQPLIALSNGQTRRARIVRALLLKPEMIILEEPLTGLDDQSRLLISGKLLEYHRSLSPQIIMTLRSQDTMPDWVTHVVQTKQDATGRHITYVGPRANWTPPSAPKIKHKVPKPALPNPQPLVELTDVNVSGRTPILHNIDWTIKEGERWLLRGHNGSGKTTLLCMITGDHPQSYQQDVRLFSKPRDRYATPILQSFIGHTSPEIFNAFPRRFPGLNALEAIATGYESVYVYRPTTPAQEARIRELAAAFDLDAAYLATSFSQLTAEQQSLTLLLRALVKRPKLLILDEPFAGMTEGVIEKCKAYLDKQLDPRQAVILITHFLEEKPDSVDRVLWLDGGRIIKRGALDAVVH